MLPISFLAVIQHNAVQWSFSLSKFSFTQIHAPINNLTLIEGYTWQVVRDFIKLPNFWPWARVDIWPIY